MPNVGLGFRALCRGCRQTTGGKAGEMIAVGAVRAMRLSLPLPPMPRQQRRQPQRQPRQRLRLHSRRQKNGRGCLPGSSASGKDSSGAINETSDGQNAEGGVIVRMIAAPVALITGEECRAGEAMEARGTIPPHRRPRVRRCLLQPLRQPYRRHRPRRLLQPLPPLCLPHQLRRPSRRRPSLRRPQAGSGRRRTGCWTTAPLLAFVG